VRPIDSLASIARGHVLIITRKMAGPRTDLTIPVGPVGTASKLSLNRKMLGGPLPLVPFDQALVPLIRMGRPAPQYSRTFSIATHVLFPPPRNYL